ncbi:MAG: MFS transporter [Bacteroidetes bacterium]|nr:MFS transporter [Bacteroidota bacterium]HET6245861.1 MFS transporter [Bacteroidia bacterium]
MNLRSTFFSKQAYEVFEFPDFRRFIAARILLTLAVQIQNVTLYWQVFAITGDPLSLGLIGLSEALPALAVALYAGHLADKYDRKKIAFFSLLLFIVTSFFLFLFAAEVILVKSTFPIYLVVFISGLARGFYRPASFALMTQLVPRKLYPKSAAWNSTFWQASSVLGAATGGVLIGFAGISSSFFTAFALIAAGAFLILLIKSKTIFEDKAKIPLLQSLTSGVKFVFSNQVIFSAMTLDLVAVLFGGAIALLPVFASDILFVGPIEFGFLNAAPAAGAIITALFLAYKPPVKKAGMYLIFSVGGFGLCMILFALSTNFYISLIILAFSGLFDSISVVVRSTIMQLLTPDHMRGRVSAVNTMFIGSSNELGAFESGVMAKLIGLVPSVVLGGGIAVVSALGSYKLAPKLRNLSF